LVPRVDFVVLGAGVSGLVCARDLARAGANVALLEARDRIGGRILTHHEPSLPVPIELGAEFIHGRPHVLWEVIDGAGLGTWELAGRSYCYENGSLSACSFEEQLGILEDLKNYRGPDISFAEYLRIRSETEGEWASAYVEGFNAADQSVIGVASLAKQQEAEDNIEGSRLFRVKAGYEELPRALLSSFVAKGGIVHKNAEARQIHWKKNEVKVIYARTGASTESIAARSAIVTVPLGVLLNGRLRFDPFPEEAFFHLRRLAFGNVHRVTLVFDDCFWNQDGFGDLSFLHSLHGTPPTWWTSAPLHAPVITGWVGGTKAQDERLDEASFLIEQSVATIAKFLSRDAASVCGRLRGSFTHNWARDPYARGAYSYIPAGALDAPLHLARPVDGTLFFAGEHTDAAGHWGTVHGALDSGIRAARDALAVV
jgi:monoamine oxidase